MPTLAAVNLAFNSVYNCMAFWFQDTDRAGEQMGALQHHRKESAESMLAERDNTHHHY